MAAGSALAALGDARFRWYFTARTVSMAGSSMVSVALAFAVLQVEDRASALALVVGGRVVATVVFLLVGGVVADRLPRILVLQASHVLTCLTQGLAAALVLTGHATVGRLVAVEVVNGAVSAFTMPAMTGIVPLVVSRPLLQQGNALLSLSRSTTQIAGPALAGILVAGVGPGWALATDSLTYAVAVLALSRVHPTRETRAPAAARPSMLTDLREGWGEFVARTWVWVVVCVFMVLNAIHIGAIAVVGPTVARATPSLGSPGWGLAQAAEAVGTVLVTLLLLTRRPAYPLRVGMLAVSAFALPMAALGLRLGLVLVVLAFLASGVGEGLFGVGWDTALQSNVPEAALSRVSSYDLFGSFVAMPVGTFVYGWLGTGHDPHALLVWSALAYAVLALGTLAFRSVRTLRSA